MSAGKLHADDTPVPVLAPGTGKIKLGRLWTYVRDDRPAGDSTPPAVWFAYSPDRRGEHPRQHLRRFSGTLQADAYAMFHHLYEGGPIQEAACWAHVRRKFYELQVAHASPLAAEALKRIAELYAYRQRLFSNRLAFRPQRRVIQRLPSADRSLIGLVPESKNGGPKPRLVKKQAANDSTVHAQTVLKGTSMSANNLRATKKRELVVAVLIISPDGIPLVRDPKKDPPRWKAPGGRGNPGELAEQVAVREVKEERRGSSGGGSDPA